MPLGRHSLNAIARLLFGLRRPSKTANMRRLHERGENLQALGIREATADDIPALAALHMKTWSDTYWMRNPPTYQIRERQWREQFTKTDRSWFCFVVENQKGAGRVCKGHILRV